MAGWLSRRDSVSAWLSEMMSVQRSLMLAGGRYAC